MAEKFDFIVIGGGSGGIAAARRAAEYGARTLLFEPSRLGGTCVNVGCVPKKVMWNAAQIHHALELCNEYGFKVAQQGFHWETLKTARDAYVGRLNKIYADNLDASGVRVLRAAAKLQGPGSVQVGSKTYQAKHILLATGSMPVLPPIPGAEFGITSDGFFELPTQPMKPLIIGAGYIATELAGLLHGLGSRVTMLLRKDKLLRAFDSMLGTTLMQQMRQRGIDIRTGVQCNEIVRTRNNCFGYRADGGQEDLDSDYDCVLFAISRTPNVAEMGLESAGVSLHANGFIEVDEFQNTSVAGLYAVGDVTPAVALTPVAIAAGRRLAERLFGNQPQAKIRLDNVASVVFSHPPIASVGLSQERAIAIHGEQNVTVHISEFVNMRYSLGTQNDSSHKPTSLVKLVTVGNNQQVVGCHVLGDGADEMLQGFAVAMNLGATKADFDDTIAIHPTAAEELVTLR